MIAKSENAINTYKPLIPGAYIFFRPPIISYVDYNENESEI